MVRDNAIPLDKAVMTHNAWKILDGITPKRLGKIPISHNVRIFHNAPPSWTGPSGVRCYTTILWEEKVFGCKLFIGNDFAHHLFSFVTRFVFILSFIFRCLSVHFSFLLHQFFINAENLENVWLNESKLIRNDLILVCSLQLWSKINHTVPSVTL